MKIFTILTLLITTITFFAVILENADIESCCPRGGGNPPPTTPGAPTVPIPPTLGTTPQPKALPAVPRPPLSIGLMPLIQSMQAGASSLGSVAEPWEVWWSRNRDKYLPFRKQIQWLKIVDSGGTKSVSLYPLYDELVKILSEAVGDKDHYLAFRAAVSLGKAQDAQNTDTSSKEAVEILKKAHDVETRFFVRNNILLGLGLTRDSSAAQIINDVLKNKKDAALRRSYAALAAGYVSDDQLLKTLKQILSEDDDKEVKSSACISLGNLRDKSSIALLGKILNTPAGEKKELPNIRACAALGLGRIGGIEALEELKKITPASEKETEIRSAVVVGLGLSGLTETRQSLIAFLQDRNPITKGLAAISLGQINDPKVFEVILESYKKNRSNEAEGLFVIGLALTGEPKAKEELRKILDNKKSRALLKSAAAIGLGLLNDTDSVPLIVNILKDEKQQNDVILTPYLILSLGMLGDTIGVEVLQKIWDRVERNVNIVAYSNLAVAYVNKRLANHANSKDIQLNANAAHALGLVGVRESAQSLVTLYRNTDNSDVKRSVVVASGFLLDKNNINALNMVTADNIDIQMTIMNHILPIPVW